jgi:MFS family permease
MSFPEEQPKPEETSSPEEIPSTEEPIFEEEVLPEGFTPLDRNSRLPRARRRRARRMLVAPSAGERAALMDNLARRASPSFEFFLFAFLGGIILGAAYLLDSPALLLLGILVTPLLTPWVGLTLSIQTGSWRFFFLTLASLLVACLLVFFTGFLAGWAGHLWLPLPLFHAIIHSHLWWLDLFLVVLGAVLLTISFTRSENKPILPSIMLAYGLFLPLSAGGVGMGIGDARIWPYGVLVFLVHLALSMLVSGIALAAMHFKPAKAGGYLLPIIFGLLSLAALVYFTGLTDVIREKIISARRVAPTPTVLVLPSMTPVTTQPPAPTSTFTPSSTPLPQPTVTPTPQPTPSYAIINAPPNYLGANLRSEPGGGAVLTVLNNGIIVQVLPEIQTAADGTNWVHVVWNDIDGWVLTSVLTATTVKPPPTFTPTP